MLTTLIWQQDIDVVILATCTPDSIVPSAAAHVQQKMECVNATAYDVNAACAGFLYGLEQAKAFVESGLYKNASEMLLVLLL